MSAPNLSKDSYTSEQVNSYLAHIGIPQEKHPRITVAEARTSAGLEYLTQLQKYQLCTVPFENLSLHYSVDRLVSLDKDDLFEKIVGCRNGRLGGGRGGYCMENNLFFGTILKSLGFDVVPVGARVWLTHIPGGWSHQINLVFIEGKAYVVDVGFGGNGPSQPLPLVEDQPLKWGATGSEMRLVYAAHSNPSLQGLWTYQHRISPSHPWVQWYSFGMTEFLPQDFEIMNLATYTRKTSWFTYRLLCLKMVLDEESEQISGVIILAGGNLKKRVFGKEEVLADCKTELERLEALDKWFGIVLSDKQQNAIKGTITALQ